MLDLETRSITYIYTPTNMCILIYVYIYICTQVCIYLGMYTCMYIETDDLSGLCH